MWFLKGWSKDAPNNAYGFEHCMYLFASTGLWDDVPCDRIMSDLLCEQSYGPSSINITDIANGEKGKLSRCLKYFI